MQVLSTKCPYCQHEVDSTIEHLDGPVVCPSCEKPFEMEMPTAVVTAVRQIDETEANESRMASEPDERTLIEVHPIVFRARPIATLAIATVGFCTVVLLLLSLSGLSLGGYSPEDLWAPGSGTVMLWASIVVFIAIAGCIAYWVLQSRFTTLIVTNDRTIYRKGIVSRETSEVQHNDVRNIQLDQSFFERLLGVGTVGVSSAGQDDLEIVAKRLPHPERIIDRIRENQD